MRKILILIIIVVFSTGCSNQADEQNVEQGGILKWGMRRMKNMFAI